MSRADQLPHTNEECNKWTNRTRSAHSRPARAGAHTRNISCQLHAKVSSTTCTHESDVVGKNDCNVRKTHPRCSMENERHVVLSGPRLWQLVSLLSLRAQHARWPKKPTDRGKVGSRWFGAHD